VSDVEYPDTVFEDAIEDFVRVPDEWNDVHAWTFDDPRSHLRACCYVRYDLPNADLDGGSHRLPKHAAIGGHFTKVRRGALAELNFHSRRNDLNAASISSSLATPLCSASSIAASSSGVA